MIRKGIILAGGTGTRLYPTTQAVTKQLLPVYDKPMIYYPLSILMMKGIKDILIIVKPEDLPLFENLLGNGEQWGINIQYKIQDAPRGLPDAFILGEEFIGSDPIMMILGDNIFYGSGFINYLSDAQKVHTGASIFAFHVKNPERFGVVNFTKDGRILSIEEKPQTPKSDWAISGIYIFSPDVVDAAKNLRPSERGETEIVDLFKHYQAQGRLNVKCAPRGFAWLDTGTPSAMMQASKYIQIIEERQGTKIACLEEIAHAKGLINFEQFKKLAEKMGENEYADYVRSIVKDYEH